MLSIWTSLNIFCFVKSLPITRRQILDSSKLKEFADDNFKFEENGRKLSKEVENTVRKGEIARYDQFLIFSQCFQKTCFPGALKSVIVWKCVNTREKKVCKLSLWLFDDGTLLQPYHSDNPHNSFLFWVSPILGYSSSYEQSP